MRQKIGARNPDEELAKAFKVFDDDSSVGGLRVLGI
jgi:Ca2+-binding EF-hand superfamily protein